MTPKKLIIEIITRNIAVNASISKSTLPKMAEKFIEAVIGTPLTKTLKAGIIAKTVDIKENNKQVFNLSSLLTTSVKTAPNNKIIIDNKKLSIFPQLIKVCLLTS